MHLIKRLLLTITLPCIFSAMAAAQTLPFFLESYTIPLNSRGAAISRVLSHQGPLKDVRLLQDTSGLFAIKKNGQLALKKQASLVPGGAFQYQVTLQAGNDTAVFVLVKDEFIRNRVVAHRGAWKHTAGSQNSLTSLKEAIRLGCEGTEFDVWMTADKRVALSHDPEIGGKKLEESTLADLQTVSLKNGDRVPTLEEYLETGMTQPHTRLVLEIKPSRVSKERGQELAAASVAIVQRLKAQAWIYYISFDYDILKKVLELDPAAKVAYLNGDRTPEELKKDGMWGLDYNFNLYNKDKQLLSKARKQGITTNIWTVNTPELMEELLQAGIDFITTDEPEMLLEKVKSGK
jgi:glycerophosphoryl diester phosphodiesterase